MNFDKFSVQIIPVRYWLLLTFIVFVVNLLFSIDLIKKVAPEIEKLNEDFKLIVNYRDFNYLISKPKCVFKSDKSSGAESLNFIILVHSDPINFARRIAIRDTWGSHVDDNNYDPRYISYFLLGKANSTELQTQIEAEDNEFGDIIQGNFIDSFRNLTYKHVMGLKWFTYNCAEAKYMVKMDDDVFINAPNVYKYLVNNNETTNFMMGRFNEASFEPPNNGEHAITEEEYPPQYYPSYADRFAIIYSNDVAIRLYRKAQKTKFFFVDNVFVTGLLRMQLNVVITDISPFLINQTGIDRLKIRSRFLPQSDFMFSIKNITLRDHQLLWEKTEWNRLGLDLQQE